MPTHPFTHPVCARMPLLPVQFFPIIFDGAELYKVMSERCGSSVTSGRKGAGDDEDEDEE